MEIGLHICTTLTKDRRKTVKTEEIKISYENNFKSLDEEEH